MEKGTTLFLKTVLIVMGLPVLAFCILILPSIAREILGYHPEYSNFIYAVLIVMYTLIMPFFYILGEFDDAPGIILIGLILIFASLVIAFFAAILQKLLKDAIEFKSENDLTV